jgi:uncharacterized protein
VLLAAGVSACRSDPRAIISTKSGKEYAVRVETADTPAKRELGLQYRRELADDQGMLFLFPAPSVLAFWMKNTPISLDMIFISSDLRIVGIVRETVPFSLEPLSAGVPSQYVLEIKGGLARAKGIDVGDRVKVEGVSLESVKD